MSCYNVRMRAFWHSIALTRITLALCISLGTGFALVSILTSRVQELLPECTELQWSRPPWLVIIIVEFNSKPTPIRFHLFLHHAPLTSTTRNKSFRATRLTRAPMAGQFQEPRTLVIRLRLIRANGHREGE